MVIKNAIAVESSCWRISHSRYSYALGVRHSKRAFCGGEVS